jgi:hypothetical protein
MAIKYSFCFIVNLHIRYASPFILIPNGGNCSKLSSSESQRTRLSRFSLLFFAGIPGVPSAPNKPSSHTTIFFISHCLNHFVFHWPGKHRHGKLFHLVEEFSVRRHVNDTSVQNIWIDFWHFLPYHAYSFYSVKAYRSSQICPYKDVLLSENVKIMSTCDPKQTTNIQLVKPEVGKNPPMLLSMS